MIRPRWEHVWLNNANVLTCCAPAGGRAGMGGVAAEGGAGAVVEV